MKPIILDLYGGTGAWSLPYKKAGFDVRVLTLPGTDLRNEFVMPMGDIYGVFAAPPCTMFSLARSRAKTKRDLEAGMEHVKISLEIIWKARLRNNLQFWALENPKGFLHQFIGEPRFIFDPSEYGYDYNKKTCIWGWFNKPGVYCAYTRYDSTNTNSRLLPPLPADYEIDTSMRKNQMQRSITCAAFAQEFYRANH